MSAGRADVIAVFGCAVGPGGVPSQALQRRVRLAARAHREGVAPRVLASGGRRWGANPEALVMRAALVEEGVPRDAIDVELCSLSTVENGFYVASWMRRRGWSRALVATCWWHHRRAARSLERWGVQTLAPPRRWVERAPIAPQVRAMEVLRGIWDASLARRGR